MNRKKCRYCKEYFRPIRTHQHYCFSPECSIKEREAQWKKEKKKIKEELKTVQDLMTEAQVEFNTYIRIRDKDKPCISCGCVLPDKYDAGHYVASGKSKFLTYHEDNVHAQCVNCNQHNSGNTIEYRINLIKRIGEDRVKWLEENRHKTVKYTREELTKIKEKYKQKIKDAGQNSSSSNREV